jgi:hypothetical protein
MIPMTYIIYETGPKLNKYLIINRKEVKARKNGKPKS